MQNFNFTKTRTFQFLFILLLLIISGCTWYKTLQVEPITDESLTSVHEYKKTVIIHNLSGSQEFILDYFKVEKDIVKGIIRLAPAGKKHDPVNKSFRKGQVSAYQPLSTMHIFTGYDNLVLGEIEIPLSDISNVKIHDKNVGWSIASSSLLIIVGAASNIRWWISNSLCLSSS